MGVVIEMNAVTYFYPLTETPAVKDVSLKIEEGKFYGIIGANGSGKTTLCSLIRGFVPDFYKGSMTGEVLVLGKSASEYAEGELSLAIGYVFQNPFNQISGVRETVFEEIAFGLENFGVPVCEIEDRVEAVMRLTGVLELAEKNPFELSGGQRQRVAVASVVVLEPDILVLDEPTSQLDPKGCESIFEIIAELKKRGKTIIMAEHKIDLLAVYADEIFVLDKGALIDSGPVQQIFGDASLMEKGVKLPQASVHGHRLRGLGVKLPYIPVTGTQCEALIRGLVREKR